MDNRPDQSGSNYGGYRPTPGIRRKILIPLGLTLAVIVSSALYSLIALQNHNAEEDLSQKLVQIEKSFQDILDDDTNLIKALLDRIADNPKIQKAWQSKNREQLLRRCLPLFDEYNSKYRITHFYFHDPDRYCFLRVHNPERYGDSIIRYTMTEAGQSGMISSGIELGPLGTFTLRVVAPWRIDGELVGYLELGEEIEHITDQLTQMYDVELIFTVEKKFLDRSGWENGLRVMGKEGDWDRFDDIVAIDHSLSHLPYNLVPLLDNWQHQKADGFPETHFDNRMYRLGFTDLYDVSEQKMGSIVMLVDFSEESAYLSRFTIILLGLGCIAGIFCFWFFNMFLVRLESRLKNAHRKLVEEIDIRKRTEKLLSFTKYSIDNIAVSAFWVDRKGGFIYVNPAACQYLGYSEQELLQMKVWDVAPEFPQEIWGEHWQQMQKVRQLKVETVQKHRSGKVSPSEASLNYVEFEGKQSIVAFISDISERIKSENELKRINLFLKETQRIATVGGWELDLDSKEFYLTDEVYKILDYPSEKLITMQDAVSLCHPDYLDTLNQTLDNAIAHGKPYDLRLRYKTYKGRDIWIRAIGRKSVSKDKRTVLHGTLQDITAQKLWEQKIQASEEKFRMLLQKAIDGIVIHTAKGEFLVVNDRMHNSLGYTREEFMRLKLIDILSTEIAEEVPSRLEELKAKGNTVFESVHVKKDGSHMPVEVASQEIVFEGQTAYLSIVRDITQRKKSEETIKAQLQFMSTLIETIPNPIFYKDRRGVYLGCNRAFADQILGLDKEDIIGATVYDLPMQIPTKLADDYHSQDLRLIQSGGYQVYESKVKCADGVEREFHFSKACYKDAGGDTAGLVGVMLDLTERRKIEKALRESESKYRGIYDNAQIGLFRTTIEEGQVIECNARFAEILGYPSVESCIRNCVLSSMYVDTRDRQRMVAELQQTGRISNYEAQFVNNVGKTKWIRYSARFLKEMNCLEGVAVEISEEKEALEMQHKSSQQVVNILASISDGFYILNDDLQITYFNKAAEEILGKTSDQVFGRNLFKAFPEFENSFLQESYRVAVREKKQMSFEIPLIVNGREDWFDIRVYPFEEGISVYFQSILERKRFEQVLKEKEYKLQSTLDTAADGIIVIDSYGMIDTFNPAVERMFGYMIEEVKNKNVSTLIPDLLKKVIYPTLAETAERKDLSDETTYVEMTGIKIDGSAFPLHVSVSEMLLDNQKWFTLIVHDMTAERENMHKLMEVDKFSAIGTLASGVAHEFKNYLAGIIGNASFALEYIDEDDGLKLATDTLEQVIDIGEKANQVALSLLTYSRKRPQDKSWENINSLIMSAIKLLEKELRENNIELTTDLKEVPDLFVAAGRIQQLVLNLLLNSREATGRGGKIGITSKVDGSYIILKVEDNGRGIDEKIIGRVFDPFFSTKGVWGEDYKSGSGLGLSICRNIVEDYEGRIDISSKPGEGTLVTVRLPMSNSDWQDLTMLADRENRNLVLLALKQETIEHFQKFASERGLGLIVIENCQELIKFGADNPLVVLDAEFPGMGELYRVAEICQDNDLDYIVVNTGRSSEYQLRGLLDSARMRYVELPGSRSRVTQLTP